MSIIVYAPQGSGKALHAEKLRKHYKMDEVVDADFDPYPITDDQVKEFKAGKILFLTHIDPTIVGYATHSRRVIPFKVALAEANGQ